MFTEEEAKRHECKRFPVIAVYGPDAGNYVDYTVYCSASACMMWRWKQEPYYRSGQGDLPPVSGNGYCGLAGKP